MDYFCICPQFTSGQLCQFYNPGCSNYGCLNGGSCFLNVYNQPECACKTGYKGKFCETCKLQLHIYLILSISSNIVIIFHFIADHETCNSCFNGGTCTRKNGVDTCTCPSNFNYILNLFVKEKCLIIFKIL